MRNVAENYLISVVNYKNFAVGPFYPTFNPEWRSFELMYLRIHTEAGSVSTGPVFGDHRNKSRIALIAPARSHMILLVFEITSIHHWRRDGFGS